MKPIPYILSISALLFANSIAACVLTITNDYQDDIIITTAASSNKHEAFVVAPGDTIVYGTPHTRPPFFVMFRDSVRPHRFTPHYWVKQVACAHGDKPAFTISAIEENTLGELFDIQTYNEFTQNKSLENPEEMGE